MKSHGLRSSSGHPFRPESDFFHAKIYFHIDNHALKEKKTYDTIFMQSVLFGVIVGGSGFIFVRGEPLPLVFFQKQFNTLSERFAFRDIVFPTILDKAGFGLRIQPDAIPDILGVICFWSAYFT